MRHNTGSSIINLAVGVTFLLPVLLKKPILDIIVVFFFILRRYSDECAYTLYGPFYIWTAVKLYVQRVRGVFAPPCHNYFYSKSYWYANWYFLLFGRLILLFSCDLISANDGISNLFVFYVLPKRPRKTSTFSGDKEYE